MLYPVTRKRVVWTIHLQDIIAVGALLKTGELSVSRIVALSGPPVSKPRLLRTRVGVDLETLCSGEFEDDDEEYIEHGHSKTGRKHRIISGSALSGRTAQGDIHGYLSRYHRQITILREGREREFIGWMLPGANKFSSIPIFISSLFHSQRRVL